jgi:hypothetical protein
MRYGPPPPTVSDHVAKGLRDEYLTVVGEPFPDQWAELLILLDQKERASGEAERVSEPVTSRGM